MFYLIMGILCSSMLSIIMRISEKYVKNNIGMLVCNYIVCSAVSFVTMGGVSLAQDGTSRTVAVGLIAGAFYLAGFVLLNLNIRKNGVVLPATFMKLGLLVSTGASVLFFHERPDILQLIGFVVAVAAIIIINSGKDATAKLDFKLGLILLLFCAGMGDVMSKIFDEICPVNLSGLFLFVTFLTAGILCVCVMLYNKQTIGPKEFLFGALIGIPNYYSSMFVLKALETIDAVIVFPTFSVGCIMVVTLTGVLFFKEKLTKKQFTALAMIMAALAMLNM